jgi:hypothetical protein
MAGGFTGRRLKERAWLFQVGSRRRFQALRVARTPEKANDIRYALFQHFQALKNATLPQRM